MDTKTRKRTPRGIAFIEFILFNVKWILPLFYLGLVLVLFVYGLAYARGVFAVLIAGAHFSTEDMEIVVLDFVDVVMIANLVKMIITGSYNSFVSKDHGRPNENISSGTLKIKISTSIIVVCSIHLLRNFVADRVTLEAIQTKLWIFGVFLATTLVLGILEYLHIQGRHAFKIRISTYVAFWAFALRRVMA
jgi:uncharacterized protein (TIGR00645 family)